VETVVAQKEIPAQIYCFKVVECFFQLINTFELIDCYFNKQMFYDDPKPRMETTENLLLNTQSAHLREKTWNNLQSEANSAFDKRLNCVVAAIKLFRFY